MGVAKQLDETYLGHFTPLNTLTAPLLDEAVAHSRIERHPPGRIVFRAGEPGTQTLFLLSGQLALLTEGQPARTIRADSREAGHALAEICPPRSTALASTSVSILSIDSARLEELLQRNEAGAPPPAAATDIQDSIFQGALSAPIFSRLPKPHLQVLKKRLSAFEAEAGEVILHEGDAGEYYYLVVSGRCRVSRRPHHRGRQAVIAELGPGEGFGEGALIAHDVHDSTVTMLEKGRLLRLAKGEFLTLLVRPFIKWIPYRRMLAMKAQGAILLDIRSTGVFRRRHLQDSVNMPLNILRQCAPLLDKRRRYVVCSDIGRRASTAAFLLAQQGMDVKVLDESMRTALQKEAMDSPPGPVDRTREP